MFSGDKMNDGKNSRIIPHTEGFQHLQSVKLLKAQNISFQLIELARPPKSAQEVEEMFGCELKQVIKTILFTGDKDVLVCIPGNQKADLDKIRELLNVSKLRIATPQEVKEKTGFEVGGVCPFVENPAIVILLDESVLENKLVNIGAGTPVTGVELRAEDLEKIWNGKIEDIC